MVTGLPLQLAFRLHLGHGASSVLVAAATGQYALTARVLTARRDRVRPIDKWLRRRLTPVAALVVQFGLFAVHLVSSAQVEPVGLPVGVCRRPRSGARSGQTRPGTL